MKNDSNRKCHYFSSGPAIRTNGLSRWIPQCFFEYKVYLSVSEGLLSDPSAKKFVKFEDLILDILI